MAENKFCGNCGVQIDENVKFCPNCGNAPFGVVSAASNTVVVKPAGTPSTKHFKTAKATNRTPFIALIVLILICAGIFFAKDKIFTKDVQFSTFTVSKRLSNAAGGFAEMDLKLPKITGGNSSGTQKINQFFIDKQKEFELGLEGILKAAHGQKVAGKKSGYFRSADYSLAVKMHNILSISAKLDGAAGGVSWASLEGCNFDLDTGKKLKLADIFKTREKEYLDYIYNYVLKIAAGEIKSRKRYYFFGLEEIYSGEAYDLVRKEFKQDNFYLTENALIVFYQKYSLAPGAVGPILFKIPYGDIANMLKIAVKTK